MVEYRKGDENKALFDRLATNNTADHDPCPILVLIYDLRNNDEVVRELRLDYGKAEDRKTLGRFTFWAIRNHHAIETIAIADAEAETNSNG